MAICSYCGKDRPPTREHIIPSWYYRHDPGPNDSGFMDRARSKIVKTELVVKDVCSDCNSGPLSALDAYAKELFSTHFCNFMYVDSTAEFAYDFDLLTRWLLKVSYNSGRANGADFEILGGYRSIITGSAPLPKHLILQLRTIAPTAVEGGKPFPARSDSVVVDRPEWFRVGVFRVDGFDSMYWAFRHITVNSFSFLVCVPDVSPDSGALGELPRLAAALERQGLASTRVDPIGFMPLPTPLIDSIAFNQNHVGHFPLTYKLIEHDILKAAIDGRFDVVSLWLDRGDIETKNLTPALDFLNDLISSREVCMGMRGKVEVSVDGYNDDSREIYEISEVIDYVKALDEAWPYWMLFQHEQGSWLQIAAVCLSEPVSMGKGKVKVNNQLMSQVMTRWFCALNDLSHRFAISVEVNKKYSEQASRILMSGQS